MDAYRTNAERRAKRWEGRMGSVARAAPTDLHDVAAGGWIPVGFYDIFNGDADGLCALQQLRLAEPRAATLVTGTKRDIALLDRVQSQSGDDLTVLDVSMRANATGLRRALASGARVRWFDHHDAGEIPVDANLEAHLDFSPGICTSLIVDRHLGGRFRAWAVAGAFGDNLAESARAAAATLGLRRDQRSRRSSASASASTTTPMASGSRNSLSIPRSSTGGSRRMRVRSTSLRATKPFPSWIAPAAKISLARWPSSAAARHARNRRGRAARCVLEPARLRDAGQSSGRPRIPRGPLRCSTPSRGTYTVSLRAPRNHPLGAEAPGVGLRRRRARCRRGINGLPARRRRALSRRLPESLYFSLISVQMRVMTRSSLLFRSFSISSFLAGLRIGEHRLDRLDLGLDVLHRFGVRIARADHVGEVGGVLAVEHEVDELCARSGRGALLCDRPSRRAPAPHLPWAAPCRMRNPRLAACASGVGLEDVVRVAVRDPDVARRSVP